MVRAGKCNYRDVLAKLKSNLSADTSQVLDGLLVELKVGDALVADGAVGCCGGGGGSAAAAVGGEPPTFL